MSTSRYEKSCVVLLVNKVILCVEKKIVRADRPGEV